MFKKALSFSTLGLALTLLFGFIAELERFHGFLLIDLFIPFFAAAWLGWKLLKRQPLKLPPTLLPGALFLLFGLSSLLINSGDMSLGEVLPAAFYGIRWAGFYFLSVIVWNQSRDEKRATLWMLFGFTFLLCLAGFVQLKIMPDFTEMEAIGWDPHVSRLLSTWFDPNFVGGFLAFMLPLILGTAWDEKRWRKLLLPLAAMVVMAIALTLSRSAYLALIAGLFVFGLLRSVKLLAALGVGLLLMVAVLPPVQARFLSLVDSVQTVFVEDYTLPDASARLRFASWDEAWQLFLEKPILGQGYNRYKYAALELGTLKDLNIHSASGGDSSLLNVLAMTGLLGFAPFLALYLLLAKKAWDLRRTGYGLGFLSALCGLFVHCIFVNSLLFPLFMAPFWISAGLLGSTRE
ncbi:MAG: O-antigen ligase family protein [Patescibacteria group bacterium]